jgi:hypothetical protein
VIIDCFTKILKMKVLRGKNMVAATEAINEARGEDITPEEIITDSENESCSEIFGEMCRRRRIKRWRIGVESHKSNSRVERLIRWGRG